MHGLGEPAGDGQAQADSGTAAGGLIVSALERLEDGFAVTDGDARATVDDAQFEGVTVGAGRDTDPGRRGRTDLRGWRRGLPSQPGHVDREASLGSHLSVARDLAQLLGGMVRAADDERPGDRAVVVELLCAPTTSTATRPSGVSQAAGHRST
jgi:hypothetical protein